jgi:hypothetical protein
MSFDYSRVLEITSLAVSASTNTLVTNTAPGKKYIRNIILHNTHTSDVVVSLFNVPNSGGVVGTSSTANQFLKATLPADDTVMIEVPAPGIMLVDDFDTIQGYADIASKVTAQMYGGAE